MKILIPTILDHGKLEPQLEAIRRTTPCEVFVSSSKASASVNRNKCLDQIAVGEIAIMIDDDIEGFYPGWVDDLLIGLRIPNAVMVSARLMKPNGSVGVTCSKCYQLKPSEIVIPQKPDSVMPSAAIAFVHRGHRFMESMVGSGWEDTAWCAEYVDADPGAVFVQSNRCKLIHRNEAKLQRGPYFTYNKNQFFRRWPKGIPWQQR